jgi:hypothetical protein
LEEALSASEVPYYPVGSHLDALGDIRTLTQIRKLGPSVQINIADKQINTLS